LNINIKKEHNHSSNILKSQAVILRNKIKIKALETTEKTNSILNTSLKGFNTNLHIHLPKIKNLMSDCSKVRRRNLIPSPDIKEEVLNNYFKKTINDDKFLLAERNDVPGSKVLIYTTYLNMIHLENSSVFVCDGTFYSCPKEYEQLYTIQGWVKGKFYPFIFCFMEKRDKESYEYIFKTIKTHLKKAPENIVVDFEMAAISSLHSNFKETRINGCFFHMTQIIWRKIQASGYMQIYKTDDKFQMNIKMILALVFIPDENVCNEKLNLLDYFQNINCQEYIITLLLWFEEIYIKGNNYKKIDSTGQMYYIWSVYKNVIEKKPTTTNSLEGWHRSLNNRVSHKNPNFFEIFSILQNEQNINELKLLQSLYETTAEIKEEPKKNLRNMCLKYTTTNGISYLLAVSLLLNLKFE
jgi:hypothetical protein